jgi:CDP-glycerol glycerophosphotransferase (TagB/SpsB family)
MANSECQQACQAAYSQTIARLNATLLENLILAENDAGKKSQAQAYFNRGVNYPAPSYAMAWAFNSPESSLSKRQKRPEPSGEFTVAPSLEITILALWSASHFHPHLQEKDLPFLFPIRRQSAQDLEV